MSETTLTSNGPNSSSSLQRSMQKVWFLRPSSNTALSPASTSNHGVEKKTTFPSLKGTGKTRKMIFFSVLLSPKCKQNGSFWCHVHKIVDFPPKAVSRLLVIVELGSRGYPLEQTVTALPPLNMNSFTPWVFGTSSPDQTGMTMSASCGTASWMVLNILHCEN